MIEYSQLKKIEGKQAQKCGFGSNRSGCSAVSWVLAGFFVLRLLPKEPHQPTVGVLWLISFLGFVSGLLLTAGVDSMGGVLTATAEKAASIHGPQSMLLRLLPVWALVTAFLVRSELFDAYESRFGALRIQSQSPNTESRRSTVVVLGKGESALEAQSASIILVSAEENYCQVVVQKGTSVSSTLVRSTLQSVEQILPGEHFMRVHRSYLINLGRVERVYRQGRRFVITMRNWKDAVPVARSRLDDVLKRLEV